MLTASLHLHFPYFSDILTQALLLIFNHQCIALCRTFKKNLFYLQDLEVISNRF